MQRGQAPAVTASMRRPRVQGSRGHALQSFRIQAEVTGTLVRGIEDLSEITPGALLSADQDLSLVTRYSRDILFDKLLDHFSAKVVPRMTWIEVPGNLWPTALSTFAQGSECLSLSLICLAAAHLSATQAGTMNENSPFHQMHNQLRELSLRSVNNQITKILKNRPDGTNETIRTWLTEVLASVVALRYSEAFVPTPSRWQLHLRGCQTIVDQLSSHQRKASERPVETFLIKEVADFEALDAFSSFGMTSLPATMRYPLSTSSNSFWGFLGLIREITYAERTQQRSQQDHHTPAIDMTIWYARAQESYLAIASNTSNMFSSQEKMRCFNQVVRAHYHATIIYSYHALAPAAIIETEVTSGCLFEILGDICTAKSMAMEAFWHDLFFPLLIAGAQCSNDKGLQRMIERLFLTALSKSGVWCNDTSLRFLRSYWQRSNTDADMTWIQYARCKRTQAKAFIVF